LLTTIALAAFVAAPANAASGAASDFLRVPVASPHIRIVDENGKELPLQTRTVEPEDEIMLRIEPGSSYFLSAIPADVEAGIAVLRKALPEDYLQLLMEEWGFERVDGHRLRTGRSDLRGHDLAHFLFERWVFAHPDTQLAKEFDCLSWGEEDIGPFLSLLVQAEAADFEFEGEERYRLRRELEDTKLARVGFGNSHLLLVRCQDLIATGAGLDDL
jgi:hypothetical protein